MGNIGRTVKPNNKKQKNIVGKYQTKFAEPSIIGDEIINPRMAFLESVKNMKATNRIEIVNKTNFFDKVLLGLINSDKQNGHTSAIHNPA